MQENAIRQFQTDKYMMFLLIAMGSGLLHCSMDDFSKVNETRIKVYVVSSCPSGHVEVRCPRGKKIISVIKNIALMLLRKRFINV